MLWRNMDSGVLYKEIEEHDGIKFIATDCLQCTRTDTLSDWEQIKREVEDGKWAAKYPISETKLEQALATLQRLCKGKQVHWITLSEQGCLTFVKMEFNDCTRDGGVVWDLVERLHEKYLGTKFNFFRKKKINRYESVQSAETERILDDAKAAIDDQGTFDSLIEELEQLVVGNSHILINLSVFNRLLYSEDYLERFVYAWMMAKQVADVTVVTERADSAKMESKIIGIRNGFLLYQRSEKLLQLALVLVAAVITALNYIVNGRSDYSSSEIKDWLEIWFLLSVSIVIGLQSLVRSNWTLTDAVSGVQPASTESDALKHYSCAQEFITDVYNRGMASAIFKDDNAGALKNANGLGWYHISHPISVHWLKSMGVRTFWRYDGTISVSVEGVKRIARDIAPNRWQVEPVLDTHGGPEVHLLSGFIG